VYHRPQSRSDAQQNCSIAKKRRKTRDPNSMSRLEGESQMQYRRLGQSGLLVSNLTLGAMTWGGEGLFSAIGSTDVQGAARQLDIALEAGVNMVDTADIYSFGRSEEILGQVTQGRRGRVLIATKAYAPMDVGPNDRGLSRHHIIEACEASLGRLNTDHIDLYQLHGWDGLTPVEETLRAVDDLTRAGKVRYFGVSNFSGWHVMKYLHAADVNGLVRPISQQIYYSLVSRDVEWELLPIAMDQGLGVMVWSPLASGLLSGKYLRDHEPTGTRIAAWSIPPRPEATFLYAVVDVLVAIARETAATPAQVALAWLLTRPAIATLVVGARTDEQLVENLRAADLSLSVEQVQRLERVSRRPLPYPLWQQVAISPDRLSQSELSLLGPYLP
jgi:aryl-alcohol dehydrogenase-like predicted oxidoreductase